MVYINKYIREDFECFPIALIGFILISFGITLTIRADIGLAPWEALNSGLSITFGIPIGRASQLIGIAILLFTMLFKVYPGVGTIFNILLIGSFTNLFNYFLFPESFYSENLLFSIILMIIGLIILTFGVLIYMNAGIGKGPRDGLFVLIYDKLNIQSVGLVKAMIEVVVIILALLLGGQIGLGTIIYLVIGNILFDIAIKITGIHPSKITHKTFERYF